MPVLQNLFIYLYISNTLLAVLDKCDESLLMSNDKEAVLAVARRECIPEKPTEIIKAPMYL